MTHLKNSTQDPAMGAVKEIPLAHVTVTWTKLYVGVIPSKKNSGSIWSKRPIWSESWAHGGGQILAGPNKIWQAETFVERHCRMAELLAQVFPGSQRLRPYDV